MVNAVQTVLPVVSALVAAHGKGIIHRDIKPENILLAEDERGVLVPKIVDFGIAKLRRDVDENRKQTQAGSVVGSPDYMSPEQARGRADIDERSDVWSMCVVIYEVVTGTCPFMADNYHAQLRAIIEERPTPIAEYQVGDDELLDDPVARPREGQDGAVADDALARRRARGVVPGEGRRGGRVGRAPLARVGRGRRAASALGAAAVARRGARRDALPARVVGPEP